MNYFDIHINPNILGDRDRVFVNNFHPNWKEAAQALVNHNIESVMNNYANQMSKFTQVGLLLQFDTKLGLTHILTDTRAALDLDDKKERYTSHNIVGLPFTLAVTGAIAHYIHHMNFSIRMLEEKKWQVK